MNAEVARIVAERDMYQALSKRLQEARRRCGFCGQPLSGPGLCGLPGTHDDHEHHEEEER